MEYKKNELLNILGQLSEYLDEPFVRSNGRVVSQPSDKAYAIGRTSKINRLELAFEVRDGVLKKIWLSPNRGELSELSKFGKAKKWVIKDGGKGKLSTLKTAASGLAEDRPAFELIVNPSKLTEFIEWYCQIPKNNESSFEQESAIVLTDPHPSSVSFLSENDVHLEQLRIPVSGMNSTISANDQEKLNNETISLTTSERDAIVKIRYGQSGFREALIKEDREKCWMSGIEGSRLLIASHIKPWSHCKDDIESRGQRNNGLLLSSLWDAAFDAGLISFDQDWQVIASSELTQSAKQALSLDQFKVLPKQFRNPERMKFLTYHRTVVFEGWKSKTSIKMDMQ